MELYNRNSSRTFTYVIKFKLNIGASDRCGSRNYTIVYRYYIADIV